MLESAWANAPSGREAAVRNELLRAIAEVVGNKTAVECPGNRLKEVEAGNLAERVK